MNDERWGEGQAKTASFAAGCKKRAGSRGVKRREADFSKKLDPKQAAERTFTGAACPNCPDAHIAIENAYAAYPGQVVAIAEYNYFADPLYLDQNMQTEEALLLDLLFRTCSRMACIYH